ncbi:unnamed protein product [Victoria cruziana]
MKATTKNKMDDEKIAIAVLDYPLRLQGFCKECSVGIVQVLSILVVFVSGMILGLAGSVHITRYFARNDFFQTPQVVATRCKEEIVKENCWSVENFVRPKQLVHGMSDEELLWRASMVPQKQEYPFRRKPKVAFLFLTKGPLPLSPLWDKFFSRANKELYSIYVHTPPYYELNVSATSVFFGRQIPSQDVHWGSVDMVDGEKRLLANALLDFSNERFVLLSESCIPVYNFDTIYDYLIFSKHSFVDSYDDPSRYGRGRYNRRMLPDIKLGQWRKGSQWFEANREVAIRIISDTKYYSIFRKHCKPSCYPDEHYIPTYLNMFYGSLNSNRSITWVDWSKGGPHPVMFEGTNITESFIRSIQNNETECVYNDGMTSTCYLFARKFAPSALEPLLNLTSTLMRF